MLPEIFALWCSVQLANIRLGYITAKHSPKALYSLLTRQVSSNRM